MIDSIYSLPDYAALKKLASALWQQDSSYHGAAVMVGAGFSKSAASTGDANRKLPLWNDFSKALAAELDSASEDPLRLAEEYCAYFGKQTLNDLIKKEVNDAAWSPGELHNSLLKLPWTEVLTTNWDTLLERASTEVHQPLYSVVSKQEDLSSARSPRIVKLHGTIDVTKELIFTQEDYRKYPQRHAAFVNFSRQVFIENELCLIGFSGDDPNFLQWAGWVRDHLSTHSRRIYLVGALGLNASKRKYLESINVAPIDLNDLVAEHDELDTKHLEATKIFIKALQEHKPKQAWEWEPTPLHRTTKTGAENTKTHQDASYAAKLLEEKLPTLEKDRLSYPGWLICPYMQRFQLQEQINDPWPNPKNLSSMTAACKSKLLYEITWHYKETYEAIPIWLANELLTVCNPEKPCAITKKEQLEIALLLLKNTRWMNNSDAESIAQTTSDILEKGGKHWADSSNELAYHKAIVARDKFDYATLEIYVGEIKSSNSIWKLRKASLLAELGQFEKGKVIVAEAYRELLGHYRNDRNSIYVLSRLAWTQWLMRGIDLSSFRNEIKAFPTSYRDSKCDPWDHIEHIRNRITDELDKQQKQQAIEPAFEPGRYKDNSNTVSFSSNLHPLLLLEGISNTVGMPLRWKGVSFLVEQAARLSELEEIDNVHRFSLAIRSANSDTASVLKKVFSRIGIACLPESDVNFLLNQCTLAINYWVGKRIEKSGDVSIHAIDYLRVFIEVLARVSVRATPEQAKKLFHLALSLGKNSDLHHFWLFDAIKHLTEFSLKSIPRLQQHEILLEALSFPLQTEISIRDHIEWANPVIKFPGERKLDTTIDRRIDEIIDGITPGSPQSYSALLRILPLIENKFLSTKELDKIADKIWSIAPDYQTLPDTGLFRYVLLSLPSKNPSSVKSLVRNYLFEAKNLNLFNRELLMDIANAAQAENIKELPSANQAVAYFQKLISWRPQQNDTDIFGITKQEERQTAELIGEALARSVIPALSSKEFTEDNFQKLYAFHAEVEVPATLIAFSYFAASNEIFIDQVEKLIKQGFQSQDPNKLACASHALLVLRDMKESPIIDRLILRLIYLIGSNRIIGLPALIRTANEMYNKEYLTVENIESLIEILPVIFDSSAYRNIAPSTRESVSISFLRAACVQLARDIIYKNNNKDSELMRIVEEAKQDALPEVRFVDTGTPN
ncbi:SIR2 family NAD-dependent protein deacylase [Vreelandella neptunia]|uniref:SIR2 family protein n=1 Tax=Vreelandella neptunia TaxID=115551 RepID=A0ABS9S412_9GAMM|nr:SIR2 family protein [Halomonas neptunia]MCH4810804.1 SIR2 family protein [Halomonas neptunia]